MSPYFDATFLGWFLVFFQRLWHIVSQLIHGEGVALYVDEIQLFTLILFGVVASFLGTFLLLKKMTMMANALSHTTLFGIVIAYLISTRMTEGALFFGAFLSTVVTVVCIHMLSKSRFLNLDVANGMVFTFLFAIASTLISLLCRNVHVGIEILTGNIDLVSQQDLMNVAILASFALLVGVLFYRGFVVSIFDPMFAKDTGLCPTLFEQLLLLVSGCTIISAFRAVGLVLVLSFFVVPPLIAARVSKSLRQMIFVSMGVTALTSLLGVALSCHLDSVCSLSLSTSALIAVLLSIEYAIVLLVKKRAL